MHRPGVRSEAQREAVALLGHDLRTPLTVAKGLLETLIARGSQLQDDEREEFLHIVARQVDRLEGLLDDLLLVVSDDPPGGGIRTEAVELVGVGEEVLQRVGIHHPGRVLECLRLRADTTASTDGRLVAHALRHLVETAVEHSSGRVTVEVGGNDAAVEISVFDQGTGMVPGENGRVPPPARTAIRLALVHRIVEGLGGRLESSARLGQGNRFSFRLPRPVGSASERATMPVRDTDHLRPPGRGHGGF